MRLCVALAVLQIATAGCVESSATDPEPAGDPNPEFEGCRTGDDAYVVGCAFVAKDEINRSRCELLKSDGEPMFGFMTTLLGPGWCESAELMGQDCLASPPPRCVWVDPCEADYGAVRGCKVEESVSACTEDTDCRDTWTCEDMSARLGGAASCEAITMCVPPVCRGGNVDSEGQCASHRGPLPAECCDREYLCTSTGGTWHEDACAHYCCGELPACNGRNGGCDCGPSKTYASTLGCRSIHLRGCL
jgi:hypothetical protein